MRTDRIKALLFLFGFYGIALIMALFYSTKQNAWIFWVATAITVILVVVFLIDHVQQAQNKMLSFLLLGLVLTVIVTTYVTYMASYPIDTKPLVAFTTGVGKAVLMFCLLGALAVMAVRVAFNVHADQFVQFLLLPVSVLVFSAALVVLIIPLAVIGVLRKVAPELAPDSALLQNFWAQLFKSSSATYIPAGKQEKVVGQKASTSIMYEEDVRSAPNSFDKPKPKSIPKKKEEKTSGFFDSLKDKFKKKDVPEPEPVFAGNHHRTSGDIFEERKEEFKRPEPQNPPFMERKSFNNSPPFMEKKEPIRRTVFTDDEDHF